MAAGSESKIAFALSFGSMPRHDVTKPICLEVQNWNFWYGDTQALFDINLKVYRQEVTVLLGPSGCGKTTLLCSLNRTAEILPHVRFKGRVLLDGEDIYAPSIDPPLLRRRFGWVAQKPDPFPYSVFENVAYGAKLHGLPDTPAELEAYVQTCLERANLWDEVKDDLSMPGTALSVGQQQRLCVARALSTRPDVLLMDEPASALDPTATAKLEALIEEVREELPVILITHNLQQAARLAQRVAYFHLGRLVEDGDAIDVLTHPRHPLVADYVRGRLG
jgi:phosphate transport system ATP-binding protein